MKQKALDTLAAILAANRPSNCATPEAWLQWSETVRDVAEVAPTLEQQTKFLRATGHSA